MPSEEPVAGSRFTLRQLEYLLAVADAGTISSAAATLHVSPTAVASALDELERALGGGALFLRRRARGVTLTASGRGALERARRVVAEARELAWVMRGDGTALRGPLALGCYTTLATALGPPLLQAFTEAHPQVELSFVAGSQRDLEAAVLAGRLDLALMYAMDLSGELAQRRLFDAAPYLLLHPEHPMAARHTVALRDVADDPLVFLDVHPSGEHTMALFAAAGVTPRIRYRTPDFELTRSLVGRGLGYAVLVQRPRRAVTFEGLTVLEREIGPATRRVGVVMAWAAAVPPTPRAQALVDLAVRTLRRPLAADEGITAEPAAGAGRDG